MAPEHLDNEHIHIYERAAGRPYQRPSLPVFPHIPVKDVLKIIAVFLVLFAPCLGLIAWVAQFGG